MNCKHRRTCQLPLGFKVEFILDGSHFDAKWSPTMPKGKQAKQILPHYRHERNAFLGSLGLGVLVLEV